MILDSSAVIAVLFREEEHERLEERLAEADSIAIGAPTLFEADMVATGLYEQRGHDLLAHPAALNLGDCMTYASAQVARQSLLFIGNDFARTDIAPA